MKAWAVGLVLCTGACSAASADADAPVVTPADGDPIVAAPTRAPRTNDAEIPTEAAPTPEPDPPEPEPEPEPEPSVAHADLDPDNDFVVGPPAVPADCKDRLDDAGVTFKPARIGLSRRNEDGVPTCGAEEVVRFRAGPGSIEYSRAPLLTCGMALALADFERIVQEEAERVLGTRVEKIDHLGTYNCRKMVNYDLISEHSFANGIDLRRFHLEDGRTVTVFEHFAPKVDDADAEPEALFLRGLSRRLYDDDVFSVVVTPYFDRLHRNHIHVDLARYRVDGSRP
ncbi:MAG: extensin family protein [Myxococcota bacterium]